MAPDISSQKAARATLRKATWPSTGAILAPSGDTEAVWGECKGSGAKPYLAAVELTGSEGPAYKCSCPSRKFPCKHVLALLALWVQEKVENREEHPPWVARWLSRRTARSGRSGAPAAPADPERAAASRRAREEAVGRGMRELSLWLYDQIETGIVEFPNRDHAHWDRMAKRLVDAKAGGAAGLVAEIPTLLRRDDWPEHALERLGLLHLLVHGHRAGERVDARVRAAVRSSLGITVRSEEVLAEGERVEDTWTVLGTRDFHESTNGLAGRRVWLLGDDSGRVALSLSFARTGHTPKTPFRQGTEVRAELAFHPDGRRVVHTRVGEAAPSSAPPGGTITEALDACAVAFGEDPWRTHLPVVLSEVAPARDGDRWCLAEPDGTALPLAVDEPVDLLANTGGRPVTIAAEWSPEHGLTPLTLWNEHGKAIAL